MSTQAPARTGTVDFGRSFSFVTEDPEWVKKILIGGPSRWRAHSSWASLSCSATSPARCGT